VRLWLCEAAEIAHIFQEGDFSVGERVGCYLAKGGFYAVVGAISCTLSMALALSLSGGAVQVDSIKIRVESAAWFQHLKLKYDELLSSFAFKFNLRHYRVGRARSSRPTTCFVPSSPAGCQYQTPS
jgi:hypothetical protein